MPIDQPDQPAQVPSAAKAASPTASPERPDKPEEACGVFAVLAPDQPVANLTYFGLYALQHRGQESAGIAVFDDGQVRLHKDMGLVSQVFDQDVLERMPGSLAIGHNRYSTTGSSRACNAQPVVLMTRQGLCPGPQRQPGERRRTARGHRRRHSRSRVHLHHRLRADRLRAAARREWGLDWDAAIREAAGRCRGAFSLVIGTPEGLYALRDGHGIRPLVFGHMGEQAEAQWVASSETCGLDIIGASYDGDVNPGELIHFRQGDPTPTASSGAANPPSCACSR